MVSLSKMTAGAAIIGALLTCSASSFASNPFAAVSDFNAVIFGNAQASNCDTQGRLAVGGDFTASGYNVGTASPVDPSKNSLVVGGNLDAQGGWHVSNGSVKYGGILINSPSVDAPYTVSKNANVVDFAKIRSQMLSTSLYLSTLAATSKGSYEYGTYTLTGSDTKLNIFNVDPNNWSAASNRVINAPTGSTVLINIAGTSGSIAYSGLQLNGVDSTSVMYNYYQATELDFKGFALWGSLLAPNAQLTMEGANVNGFAVVESSIQNNGGEYHYKEFNGNIPSVPEPSSLAACAMGLGALPLLRKRRI